MEYRRFQDKIVVRMDCGEEVLTQIREVATKENIKLAEVSALGAVNRFTVGVYKVGEKKYYSNHFEGDYEVVSCTGTINTMDGEFYTHIHMSCGDQEGKTFGGHLNEAWVSATIEMIITVIDGEVDRIHDDEIGLNLFRFL